MTSSGNRNFFRDINVENVSSGMICSIFAMASPTVVILQAAAAGGFSQEQTISWMFAVNFFGGLLSIVFPFIYRIPMTAAHSLAGVAFLVTAVSHFTYPELIGSYIVTGILIIVVGITGLFSKIMAVIPNEVIASMLAGLIATYVVKLVGSLHELPVVGGLAVAGYFLCIKWGKRIPAVMGAVVFAFIGLWITGSFDDVNTEGAFFVPAVYGPEFTVGSILSVAVPLTLLVLSNDIAAGIGALKSFQFRPPVKKILVSSGLATIFAGFFGGQSANTAGVMTAISSDESSGKKEARYVTSIISGAVVLVFGMFAWKIVPFIESLPLAVSAIIAGLALIGPLSSSMRNAFSSGRYRLSVVVAFAVALSNVSFLHISAPAWSLIIGILIAKTIEQKDDVAM